MYAAIILASVGILFTEARAAEKFKGIIYPLGTDINQFRSECASKKVCGGNESSSQFFRPTLPQGSRSIRYGEINLFGFSAQLYFHFFNDKLVAYQVYFTDGRDLKFMRDEANNRVSTTLKNFIDNYSVQIPKFNVDGDYKADFSLNANPVFNDPTADVQIRKKMHWGSRLEPDPKKKLYTVGFTIVSKSMREGVPKVGKI